jgi:hypothetical protein
MQLGISTVPLSVSSTHLDTIHRIRIRSVSAAKFLAIKALEGRGNVNLLRVRDLTLSEQLPSNASDDLVLVVVRLRLRFRLRRRTPKGGPCAIREHNVEFLKRFWKPGFEKRVLLCICWDWGSRQWR